MKKPDYLKDLEKCELCEHLCRVNRLGGETGVCKVMLPTVASAALHPAPPQSYTVFMAGCNYKCLNCQNWQISQSRPEDIQQIDLPPDKLVAVVHQRKIPAIAYTYSEPIVFYEYTKACAAAARLSLCSGLRPGLRNDEGQFQLLLALPTERGLCGIPSLRRNDNHNAPK